MNIFKTIIKAAKAVVRTVKELFGLTKAAYQAKVAKAKAWHEFKKLTNSDYIKHLVTILIALVKIFMPVRVVRAVSATFFDSWDERF
jgi:hypothetical protein